MFFSRTCKQFICSDYEISLRFDRAGSLAFLPGVFWVAGLFLHHLRHEAAHGFRRLILHLPGGVGVGAECEARVVVAKHTGDGLDVHAVLECQRGEGVPLWHNKDKSDNPLRRNGLIGLSLFFFH